MKKVLLLLCALFAGVTGAWANVGDVVKALTEISPQKAYTVNTNGRGSWTIAEGGTELKSSGNGAYGLKEPTDASNPRQQWAFVSYEEATYLYNVGEKKFILKENKKGVANATHGTPVNLETYTSGQMAGWGEVYEDFQAGEFYFCAQMGMFDETTKAYINFGGSMNTTIDGWGPGNTSYDPKCGIDAGNALKIVEAADFDPTAAIAALENYFHPSATVVYVVSDENGQVVETSEKIPSIVGETIKELPASMQREFCSYKVPETTIAAGDNTIKVTVSYTLPFEVSKDYANAKWYFAKIRGSKWLRADESQKDGSGRYLTNGTNEKTDVYQWAFVGNPYSNFVILNKAHEGKVLYLGSQPVMQAVDDPTADNAAQWAIKSNGDGFNLRNLTGDNLYINDNSSAGNLGTWNNTNAAADAGGKWNVEEVPAAYVDVTYTVVVDGKEVASALAEQQGVGMAPKIPESIAREFTSYTYDVEVLTSTTTKVTATATFNLPFEVSKDYANAKWYFAKIRGSKWLRADESQKDGSGRYLTNGTNEKTDVYQWAFVGNPYSNFVILNKAHEGKVLYLGSQPVMQAVDDPTADNAAQWAIKSNGDGFNLRNLTGDNLYINDNSSAGNLGTWNNANAAADAGGKWNIEAVPDDYASYVEADIKPWFEKAGGYFELKTEVVTANQAKYEAALQQCSVGTYQELLAVVQDDNNIRYPETGYYRLKNFYYPTRYLAYVGSNLTAIEDEGLTAASVVRLTRTSEGKYLVSLQGLSADAPAQSAKVAMSEAGAELLATVAAPGLGAFTNGNRYGALHCDKNYNIVGWEVAANATRWIVEEATEVALALNDGENGSYYATFCAPFEATVNGAKAYTMARNGDYMVATEVENIAAGMPVLLKSDAAAVKLALGTGYAAKPSAETGLTGTYVDASVQGATDYVLGKGSEGVAFYHWEGETLTANHAYVVAEPGVKCFAIDWAGETAIQGIESEAENQTIYNISGQRVQKAVKGLYIVNGKKVMVK